MSEVEKIVETLLELGDCAEQPSSRINESSSDPKDWIDNNMDDVITDQEDENSHFSVSVEACAEHNGNAYPLTDMPDGTEPQFWTVYKCIYDYDPETETYEPGLEFALQDFNTKESAINYANWLKSVYKAEGRLVEDET